MRNSIFLLISCFLVGCTQPVSLEPKKITIGFSQCTTGDDWRKTMIEEMRREIGFHPNYDIELIITDAKDNNQKQIHDIQELMTAGIDLLIVSPNEVEPLTPIVEEVYDKGIPVIVIDRRIHSEKFTSFIGGDNFVIGKEAALLASQLLHGKGRILEITGLVGSSPALERSLGFMDGLRDHPQVEVAKTFDGAWLKERAQQLTDTLFYSWKDFDLIFGHNDQMAHGTYLSAKKHNIKPFILGVDGLYVPGAGIDMILEGQLDGTFLYPTGGDRAMDLALRILEGRPYSKLNKMHTIKIDNSNARTFKMQANQLIDQQSKIDHQREQMGEMTFLMKQQKTFILLSTIIMGLLLIIALLAAYLLYQKNKANDILDLKSKTIQDQNQRITKQRDKLLRAIRVAEEATETKIRFFTDVSHEIRTVLSLISLPVDQLTSASSGLEKEKVRSLKGSVDRLVSLSKEILDFRKVSYRLKFQNANLGSFLEDIVSAFKEKALEKEITISAEIQGRQDVDFDPGVIEKVMFNLVSNAIKYTHERGKVRVRAWASEDQVHVAVEDTGMGISEEEQHMIFDRFYRGGPIRHRKDEAGAGIGLSLTKQLIQLHGGQLKVESKLDEGSTFSFSIPSKANAPSKKDSRERFQDDLATLEKHLVKKELSSTVLLVEDNEELRSMISGILEGHFSVLVAGNGQEGLESAREHLPDIIVSDILMPVMDGLEMLHEIKNNPSTFHIPIILLTAIESDDYTVKGFETGADAYLTKPFNEKVLISRIQNLLDTHKRLKKELGGWLYPIDNLKTKEKTQHEFINKCVEVIYQNASDPGFNLDYLARAMNLSRSSFCRRIKDIAGLRAVDFMKKAKLRYAAKLLLNDTLTVSEVAWQSGFSDAKYFSRVFAQEFGDLPSKFKEATTSA